MIILMQAQREPASRRRQSVRGQSDRHQSSPQRAAARGSRLRGNSRPPADFPIVGIGASAGGLEPAGNSSPPCPSHTGMAFIIVQHLDPNHESMMADLLADHTSLRRPAGSGRPADRRDHIYVIPPGTYLSVAVARCICRNPRRVMARACPSTSCCTRWPRSTARWPSGVVLSGTGADGSLGLKAVKEKGGLVIAQDPDEAGYDSMPRNAHHDRRGGFRAAGRQDSRGADPLQNGAATSR